MNWRDNAAAKPIGYKAPAPPPAAVSYAPRPAYLAAVLLFFVIFLPLATWVYFHERKKGNKTPGEEVAKTLLFSAMAYVLFMMQVLGLFDPFFDTYPLLAPFLMLLTLLAVFGFGAHLYYVFKRRLLVTDVIRPSPTASAPQTPITPGAMRVKLERPEQDVGLLNKTRVYGLNATILFSDTQKAVIKQGNLGDYAIYEGRMMPGVDQQHKLYIRDFVKGTPVAIIGGCDKAEMMKAEAQFKEGLTNLKAFLEQTGEQRAQTEEFEV